jgi:hypothetical protein
LIAGSLGLRMPLPWANLQQASIFFAPHLLVLRLMPVMWPILPRVLLSAFFMGWRRIRSGLILGAWLMPASGNLATCLVVAIRTGA